MGLQRRLGLTMVEVIVVIVILALMLALFLPALNMQHRPANRNQCRNNMRQLGLAINNYESAHNAFPLGRASMMLTHIPSSEAEILLLNNPENPWLGQLLPFLDLGALAAEYNTDVGVLGYQLCGMAANATVMQRALPTLNCPSDVSRKFRFASNVPYFSGIKHDFSKGNYVACWGNTNLVQFGMGQCQPSDSDLTEGKQNSSGMAAADGRYLCYRRSAFGSRNVTRDDVKDGVTKTIFMAELIKGGKSDSRGFLWLPISGGNVFMTRFTPNSAKDLMSLKSNGTVGVDDDRGDQLPSFSGDQPPAPDRQIGDFCFNEPPLLPCSAEGDMDQAFTGARSRHAGGVHVLLGDASVQFISDGVDPDQWIDAGSIQGSETSNSPW